MKVFVVEMCRWGDCENHSYVSGVYSSLEKAIAEGVDHADFRANKYEPKISMLEVDGATRNTLSNNLEETEALKERPHLVRETNEL